MSESTPPQAGGEPAEAGLPIFYRSLRPLDRVHDAGLRLARPTHFRFAAHTNAIPLLVDEFPLAAAYYPIVFADGPRPVPAAIVGLYTDSNLFLDHEGRWLPGSYLPAYIRRYPFLLMDDAERKQLVLCIDETSDLLDEQGEFALFEGNEPSAFVKGAMEFCSVLRQHGEATEEFVAALQTHHLLKKSDANVDLPDKTRMQLGGFLVIDPQKFDALPDEVFVEWRRKGWLDFIYAQMLSSNRWQNLIDLLQMRK